MTTIPILGLGLDASLMFLVNISTFRICPLSEALVVRLSCDSQPHDIGHATIDVLLVKTLKYESDSDASKLELERCAQSKSVIARRLEVLYISTREASRYLGMFGTCGFMVLECIPRLRKLECTIYQQDVIGTFRYHDIGIVGFNIHRSSVS